jgi:three-Cys-motif partner protein
MERVGDNPAFFFIDPSGFAGMPLRAINNILSLPHKEVLINFMWNAIRRWSGLPDLHSTVTELMGTDLWKGCQTERQWLDLYVRQLKGVGSYVWAFRNKFPDKQRTFYYLVYATKVPLAFKIMKEIMFRQDTRRLFEPDLFESVEFCDFVRELERRVRKGITVPRRQLLEFTLCDTIVNVLSIVT